MTRFSIISLLVVVIHAHVGAVAEHRVNVRHLEQLLVQLLVRVQDVLFSALELDRSLRDPLEARGVRGDGEARGDERVADGAKLVDGGEDAPAAAVAGRDGVVRSRFGRGFEDLRVFLFCFGEFFFFLAKMFFFFLLHFCRSRSRSLGAVAAAAARNPRIGSFPVFGPAV